MFYLVEFFDKESNSVSDHRSFIPKHIFIALQTGSLTAQLSDNSQKVNGLAGITLGTIVQSVSCLFVGSIIALAFVWKIGLVGIGALTTKLSFLFLKRAHNHLSVCFPIVVSSGFIRMVSFGFDCGLSCTYPYKLKRVVGLKDQMNRKAHAESAQLACEAAGSIRTVASLTREADCLALYSKSLEGPLKKSKGSAIWANLLYAFSQAQVYGVIALVFWYGATLVSRLEATTLHFFVAFMVYYFYFIFGLCSSFSLQSTVFAAIQVGSVFNFLPDISSARSAGSDIIKLLDSIPKIDAESKEGKVVESSLVKGHLRFGNIHFRYPTRPGIHVLRGLSLEVEPNTYIAIVGASGSGKSTM